MEIYINKNDLESIFDAYQSVNATFVKKSYNSNEKQGRIIFFVNKMECMIDFYFKVNGKVRMVPNGKNSECATELINFIQSKGLSSHVKDECHTFDCKKEIFDKLIEYISNEFKDKIEINTERNITKFRGYHGDTVTCTYYEQKNKLMIQSKPLTTYSIIVTQLAEYEDIDFNKIVEISNVITGQNITKELIRVEMKELLDGAYEYLDEALLKSISGSIILLKRTQFSEDYTGCLTGEFKALEGYLKKILIQKYEYKFTIEEPSFSMFSTKSSNYIGNNKFITPNIKKSLIQLYNMYKNKRNVYLHTTFDPSQTKIIENLEEARCLSNDILKLIRDSYNVIFN